MPPSKIEAGNQQLLKHKERPVLVYCKNGQVSPQMATRLTRLGFTNVNMLTGGLTQWIADQQPVTRHKGAANLAVARTRRARRSPGPNASRPVGTVDPRRYILSNTSKERT
jgi:3-mercaptopyruvate sulfurtransferase SseA